MQKWPPLEYLRCLPVRTMGAVPGALGVDKFVLGQQ